MNTKSNMNRQHRRSGCWICWKRKLKCDSSAPDHCANCAKRGVECRYDEPGTGQERQGRMIPSQHVTEAGIPRDRAQRACSNCATQKLKCSGDQHGCSRCLENNLVCRYPNTKRGTTRTLSQNQGASRPTRRRTRPPATATTTQESSPNTNALIHGISISKGLVQLHVEAYFEYVYPITTHGFLHKGVLLRNLDENKVPSILLKAIAVSSSQFVATTTQATSQTAQWAQEIDVYIMENIGSFSTMSLQVILLLANHHHSNRKMGKAWTLLGMAARIAYYLQINVESKGGSPSEKECQRRMMWNIRILDRLLAGTVEEFSLASRFLDKLKLPCNEYFYLAELRIETDTLERFIGSTESPNIGGFTGFVGLFDIWGDILLFMRDLSQEQDIEAIKLQVSSLQQRLSDLEQRLPPNLRFVDRNLYLQASAPQKITFIMLKSWWHECHYDLFRFSLPGFRESINLSCRDADFGKHCQEQAIESALTQSIFWRSITRAKQNHISDPNVVSLVHSNTRTLLACRNLTNFDMSERAATLGEVTDISDLLLSNVSFLDGLAKHFPHVTIVQREIQRVVQKNGIKCSAEAVLNEGLPLKRRHSRQELFQHSSGIEGVGSTRAEEPENNSAATAPFEEESLLAETAVNKFTSIEDGDRTMRAPIMQENVNSGISSQRQLVNSNMIHGGESMQDSCPQPPHFMEEPVLNSIQYQGLYEGAITGSVPGYFSPFDIIIDDNMTSTMDYAVFENQEYTFD